MEMTKPEYELSDEHMDKLMACFRLHRPKDAIRIGAQLIADEVDRICLNECIRQWKEND
jgi:hypothetical protein